MRTNSVPTSGGNVTVAFGDSPSLDAFGRLRVSEPSGRFDSQFTYDLQPLVYEQIIAETGATIAHDATDRHANIAFSSTPTWGKAYMQTYTYFRYQPWKSQQIFVTFNFTEAKADVLKFAGYSDGTNGIEFQNNGTTNQVTIYSSTNNGNETVTQSNWNIDKLDGTGPSKITLDITKTQIFGIDFQALYVGRVRVGFNTDWCFIPVHEFNHANRISSPYIANANLPIRCGMTCTGTVSTTMEFNCAAVISEWGTETVIGHEFQQEWTWTAWSAARTHILSIRPKTTFNSISNRCQIAFLEVDMLNLWNVPVKWELVIWQAISGTTTYSDVNATYSAIEYNTAGTISGTPAIVIDSWYVAATNQNKWTANITTTFKYPITLDAAWAVRALWTLSLLCTWIWSTSAVRASLKWTEIR